MESHKGRLDDLEVRLLKVEEVALSLSPAPATQPIHGFSSRGAASRPSITRSCALKIVTIIRNNLDMENLEIFHNSCFGHLMKINELRFQGQLMLHMLLSLDMAASSKKSLVFKIEDSAMEFGERDFHDITGLCLGERRVTSTSSFIHEHVFRGRQSIMFKEVEETFLKYSSVYQGRGELTLKLALLYFLYGILLSGSDIKKVDTSYLYLIENLDEFNTFPWGGVGHEFLVSSLLSARVRMHGSKISRLNIHGLGFALQIWAYEKMPSLATHCAKKLGDLSPRILSWSATKIFYFESLKMFFSNDEHLNYRAMSFVDTESERRAADQYGGALKKEKRQLQGVDALDLSLQKFVPRNESSKAAEVKDLNRGKEPIFGYNPISSFEKTLEETKRARPLRENPAQDMLHLLYQDYVDFFDSSKPEYERSKSLYERLLNPREHLKLWIGYAKLEAFGTNDESDSSHKRERLERAKAVIERGLSSFGSCAPERKEERSVLWKEWSDIERSFPELDDDDLVLAMLPQKHEKRMHVETVEEGTGIKRKKSALF